MAKIERALERTLRFEGGWVHDPDDRGGETYKGIARRSFPAWIGWHLIDALKQGEQDQRVLNRRLAGSTDLQHLVLEFYRENFWLQVHGDEISSQAIAEQLFDCAVHLGVKRAVGLLQEALNLLSGPDAESLQTDGAPGPLTLAALDRALLRGGGEQDLHRLFNLLRGMHYIKLAKARSSQYKFLRGWLRRLA